MPYNAGQNLLGRCLCGFFCIAATCVGFPQPPKLTSVSRALCALVSAPRAGLCIVGLVWTCFSSLCLPSASWSLCAFVSSHCLHSLSRGLFFLFPLCLEGRVRCPSLYVSPLSAPQFRPLRRLCLSAWAHPLCYALARFVCPVTLGYLGLPSVLQGLCALAGCVCCTTLSFWSLPFVWGHSP